MLRKTIILIGISLFVLLLQTIFSPWMMIGEIRPDFVLIMVLFVGRMNGRVYGQLFGFSFGLIIDFIGIGSFVGLSALAKTIAGFLSGYLVRKKGRLSLFSFHSINFVIMFIHFSIIFLVNFKNIDIELQFILLRYALPSTIYSGIIYFLLDYILPIDNE